MKTNQINVQVGIYSTDYTVRDYGHKIVITYPCIRWEEHSGTLDFSKRSIVDPQQLRVVRQMVVENSTCLFDAEGNLLESLQDLCTGDRQ